MPFGYTCLIEPWPRLVLALGRGSIKDVGFCLAAFGQLYAGLPNILATARRHGRMVSVASLPRPAGGADG